MQTGPYPEIPAELGYWLAGFIDGEGAFMLIREGGARERIAPTFDLSQRDDDRELIESLARRTGMGCVLWRDSYANVKTLVRSRPRVTWRVTTRGDLGAMVRLLERYPLQTRKARDFEVWARAVRVYLNMPTRKRYPACDWSEIVALREELMAGRAYQASPHAPMIPAVVAQLTLED